MSKGKICGRERGGVGNTGYTRWTLPEISGRKAGNLKEVRLGWINGGIKARGFGWGKIRGGGEQLFFEGLEGRIGLNSSGSGFAATAGSLRNLCRLSQS